MGMYTEFHFNAELKQDVDNNIIATLKYMLIEAELAPKTLPKHELFKNPKNRWRFMLITDSYYFDADTHSTLRYDKIEKAYFLCIRSNFKNYNNEINLFISWITPYLEKFKGDFLGFYRYENTETPTLIYKSN